MKSELSCGGVVCVGSRPICVLLIRDMNSVWTFPKGILDPGEDPLSGAVREISEETGITGLTYIKDLGQTEYFYTRNKSTIHKTVRYFLFSATSKLPLFPQKEEGITRAEWVDAQDAQNRIGYRDTNLRILSSALSAFK